MGATTIRAAARTLLASVAASALIVGCGTGATITPAATGTTTSATTGVPATTPSTVPITAPTITTIPPVPGGLILPVRKNPIVNLATAPGLAITKGLAENNISPTTGKGVGDHLEIELRNSTTTTISSIEVYYKITDKTTGVSEGYYAPLTGFAIPPGTSRTAHFDRTGGPGHFPANRYSLYYTDKNALSIDVTASTANLQPATFTIEKASGGAEAGVE